VHVVATAGHVDHGKSTLVHALTGIDPDRWSEEKERGLTIDLGFAWTTLPSGRGVAFVDVPGHVRFIRNMLAGVGAVDACLFVVSATEGWKPQSEEHLRILELLGVGHGVIALTKIGLVDVELAELAELEVLERTAGTFLQDAPVVGVDAPSGQGLDDIVAALDDLTAAAPTAVDLDRPRLWIDRVFAAVGSGTVVTGTLTGGSVDTGDELRVLPLDRAVRVRAIQSHQQATGRIGPGHRTALNLAGVAHPELTRGDVVVRDGQWHRADTVDAELCVLASLEHQVTRRGAYTIHIGSGEWPVSVQVLGRSAIAPGSRGSIRVRLPRALPLVPGDRYVLRETGRVETVGGGEILDVDPVLPGAAAAPDRSIERVVRERGWVHVDELERLTGQRTGPVLGPWVVDPAALVRATEALRHAIEGAGDLGLALSALDDRQRLVLDSLDEMEVIGDRVRRAAAPDPLVDHPVVKRLAGDLFAPPPLDDVPTDVLHALARRGHVVQLDGIWFARLAVDRAGEIVAGLLADRPGGVTVAEVRMALGTTRKYVLPLLNRLDATGVTRRRDEMRIGGPRLPAIDRRVTPEG